jgi:hypothetical protein
MSMLSGSVLGSSGDGPRRRHPVATGFLVLLMLAVLFAATFGAVRLLKGGGSDTPSASATSAGPCVTTTATPAATLPQPATITANVYNATDRRGLARATATTLKGRGFGIGSVANDPLGKTLTTVAEIRYGAQGKDNALLMRYYVLGATLVLDQRTDTTVDVVLGQKFKSIPDQKVIDKALAAPVVVASGSGCPSPSARPASPAATATRAASPTPAG